MKMSFEERLIVVYEAEGGTPCPYFARVHPRWDCLCYSSMVAANSIR